MGFRIVKHFLIILLFSIFTVNIFAQSTVSLELDEIIFNGNTIFSDSDLKSFISSKESPSAFSQFLYSLNLFGEKAVYFDSTKIDSDIQILLRKYHSSGYFKTKVKAKYKIEDQSVEIYYEIKEGDPGYFRNIAIEGVDHLSPEIEDKLFWRLTIDSSQVYSEKLINENQKAINDYLKDQGFMMAEFNTPIIVVDTILNKVDVKLNFNTGKRYKISDIRITKTGEGKEFVDDSLIDEIVNIKINDYYNLYENQLAQVRLYRTNLFSSASVGGIISDTSGTKVPLGITTDIGLLHELSPEIIMNNEDNAISLGVGLSFVKKNFLGSARKLSLNSSAAAQDIYNFLSNPSNSTFFGYADSRIILEQPFLFGRPINTKFETYVTFQKRRLEYSARLIGSKVSFEFELPKYVYLTSLITYFNWENASYEYQEEYINKLFKNNSDTLTINNVVKSTNAILGVNLAASQTNSIVFPTKGLNLSVILEDGNSIPYLFSQIGGYNFQDPMYYKIVFEGGFFPNFYSSDNDAFGIKIKLGLIHSYKGNKFDIPLNQRFAAGGSNSVRGWNSREIVPPESQLPDNLSTQEIEAFIVRGITPGGFFLMEGSFESRHKFSRTFGSAIFVDYGNVWNSYREFSLSKLAVAAGFGIRFYTEFAPIRIDFGFKIVDPNDRRGFFNRIKNESLGDVLNFQLGIGEAF